MKVAIPPYDEICPILNKIHEMEDELDSLRLVCERAIIVLQERRTGLISAAVTGQIDVRGAAERGAA